MKANKVFGDFYFVTIFGHDSFVFVDLGLVRRVAYS